MGVDPRPAGRFVGNAFDAAAHASLCALVAGLVTDDLALGVHDVADGGLALALAEMAVRSAVGFTVRGVGTVAELFGEHPSRAVVCVALGAVDDVMGRARAAGVPVVDLGVAGGDRLIIEGLLEVALADAVSRVSHLPNSVSPGEID